MGESALRLNVQKAPKSREDSLLQSQTCQKSHEELDDAELVRICQDGDSSVFRVLVKRYWNKAYSIAYGMVGNREDAWDIAQDAFVRVFKAVDSFDLTRAFHTWLYRIVTNLSIDSLRRRSLMRAVALDDLAPTLPDRPSHNSAEQRELRSRIETALHGIPGKYRAVLLLRDEHGLACKEIAKIMGCTHSTVRWRLHRARRLFREIWEKMGMSPGERV